jgi:hypothetical protein
MKQRFQDFILLIQNDRRYLIGMVVAVVGLGWAIVSGNKPNTPRQTRVAQAQQVGTGSTAPTEVADDLLRAFKNEVDTLKSESKENRVQLEKTQKELNDMASQSAEIMKKMLERMVENENTTRSAIAATGTTGGTGLAGAEDIDGAGGDPSDPGQAMASMGTGGTADTSGGGIEEFGGSAPAMVAPPPAPTPKRVAVVGAGDHVRVKLLGAVNASTDGTPYPVLFKLSGDVRGPNDSSLSLGEGYVIAAAQGSLSDSRAMFRLTSLNIAYPDGRRNVMEVDGWIVGEDGINGMEGVLIDPIGKAIGASGMSGFLEGVGQAFQSRNVQQNVGVFGGSTITVTGSEGEFAAGRGLSEATRTWSRIVENRVNKLVPVVQVLSGREATAVFARSFKVPELIEAYQTEEDAYSSVD